MLYLCICTVYRNQNENKVNVNTCNIHVVVSLHKTNIQNWLRVFLLVEK